MVNIIVCGAAGKMGQAILRLATADSEMKVLGGVETQDYVSKCPIEYKATSDLSELITAADAVIDFSTVLASMKYLSIAEKYKKPIVIGTTGFDAAQIEQIKKASGSIPVVFSPNMSIGVNVLFKIAAEVAAAMPGYDAEIVELHHNQKKDAPSGTAVKLAQVIAKALGRNLDKVAVYGRKGITEQRKKEEIGIMSVRAGDIIGDHTVYFAGNGERIELTHRAQSRDTLAQGALTAGKWVAKQKPGLYDMQDVLGLKKQG